MMRQIDVVPAESGIHKIFVASAFSLQMLPLDQMTKAPLTVEVLSAEQVRDYLAYLTETGEAATASAIGHADTAALVSRDLGIELPAARVTVHLDEHGEIIVAQYTGPRLPEGTTTLPEGATLTYLRVRVGRLEVRREFQLGGFGGGFGE